MILEQTGVDAVFRSIKRFLKARQTDERQGNTRLKQNLTYFSYVILEQTGVDAVFRCLASF